MKRHHTVTLLAGALVLVMTTAALAEAPAALRQAALLGSGASGQWRDLLRTQELGGVREEPAAAAHGPSRTGDRIKAGLLSLVLPGAGQLYNGDNSKAYAMLGVEAAIWTAYFVFDSQKNGWVDDYEEYAGLYAGTQGDHPDRFWQAVGRYLDSDAWYESQLRDARAFGEPAPPPLATDEQWQWRTEADQQVYGGLRASASKAEDRRDYMILFMVINRAVSVYDAVRNAGRDTGPALGTRVMGLDVALDVSPDWTRPEARCSVSGSF